MEFKLCYKSYPYKPSIRAIKDFKEATGKDLWSSLIKYLVEYHKSRKAGDSIGDTVNKLALILDFVESSQAFYCLAKQENSRLTIDEIEDAMFNAGILPSERDHDLSEPYPFVLFQMSADIEEYHSSLTKDLKKK